MSVGIRENQIGLSRNDYKGRPSTLCLGCGHNSISNQIIAVAFEMSLNPHDIIKLSGIGCSSKSPAYFLNRSHGFNSLHGRMPSIATGATTANRELIAIGVSGDGDTGSIGLGQFKHMVRRNVPAVYIVENNGVYGLTKGQFSATADMGQTLKYAGVNELPPIDVCLEALAADASFVARSFAGDAKQVRALLKAAISHKGTAVLDIISPCVTFNNHETSSKSYPYGKVHEDPLQDLTYIPEYDPIIIDVHEPGQIQAVEMHDGSHLMLKKLDPDKHDPTDKQAAFQIIEEAHLQNQFITGLIYVDERRPTLLETTHLVDIPLARLSDDVLRPSREALEGIMADLICCN
ncbi:MAG: 2-oxoacid:ferredoxin oxidoreductase subunit beta [Anaerolineae bacterium]|nr:2-oxoacid:ferredoxin oxidoreductase subunit beta [Anaerolineae bacterium]